VNLLLACSLLLQDKTAEETFKKIEEMIGQAKSLRIKFSSEEEISERRKGTSGVLLLQSGNRARFTENPSTRSESWSVSDGKRVQSSRHGLYDEGITGPVPNGIGPVSKDLVKNLKVLVSRAGCSLWGGASIAFRANMKSEFPEWLRVSQFKLGANDGQAKTLSYLLEVGEKSRPFDVTLWFDPESFKLLKRKIAYAVDGGKQVTTTETYDEFTFDAEIPDENFTLPE
jgi:outer membrane lipoprotein-sorting protein